MVKFWLRVNRLLLPLKFAGPDPPWLVGLFFTFWFLFCFTHQKQFDAPTPVSRLDLLHALICKGQISIDTYGANTGDKAFWKGHWYSDKAPGTVAVALPAFVACAGVLRMLGTSMDSHAGWLASSWAGTAFSNGLLASLGAVAAFCWLRRRVSSQAALITVCAMFLGGLPLPYATMMFSHAMVVGLVAIAMWATDWPVHPLIPGTSSARTAAPTPVLCTPVAPCFPHPHSPPPLSRASHREPWLGSIRWRYDVVAGAACGLAVASEYTAGLVAMGLFLWLTAIDRRRAWPFMVGAFPLLLLIPAYSWTCLGTPFVLPYSATVAYPEMRQGLYAIRWPDPETALRLLFSPSRGLCFWSPFLLLALAGYVRLVKLSGKLFWLCYLVPLLQVVIISGRVWDWQAGPAFGARYLAPALPLLALPCALGLLRFPRTGGTLAILSVGMVSFATLTGACLPASFGNPLVERNLPAFLKGEFCPNLGTVLGLPGFASVALYYLMLTWGLSCLWRSMPKETGQDQPAFGTVGKQI